MKCPKCGHEPKQIVSYCPKCGAAFAGGAARMPSSDNRVNGSAQPLPSIEDLFRRCWTAYTRRFWVLFPLAILPPIIFFIGAGIGAGLGFLGSLAAPDLRIAALVMGGIIGGLVGAAVAFWFTVALLTAALDEDLDFNGALAAARGRLVGLSWVALLSAGIIALGFCLLIVPGIIFCVWYFFAWWVHLDEERNGWAALSRSRELVRGRWWPIVGRLLLLGLAGFLIGLVPIVGWVLSLALPPFQILYVSLIYRDLKGI